jgi:uncharacterized protein (DUF3084 family)
LERLPQKAANATDNPRQTGAWCTILVGGLVTGALLLIAFLLSNNPSNPFRSRVGAETKPQILAALHDDKKSRGERGLAC